MRYLPDVRVARVCPQTDRPKHVCSGDQGIKP
jgi:hypothetical protein